MKREILFRVWDIVEKCYLPEDVYCILNTTEFRAFGQMIKDWRDYKEGEYFYDDSQILEQFTGITDINGVKIFEGDRYCVANNKVYIVRYCNKEEYNYELIAASFVLDGGRDLTFPFDDYAYEHGKVIGNIHDNKELIK